MRGKTARLGQRRLRGLPVPWRKLILGAGGLLPQGSLAPQLPLTDGADLEQLVGGLWQLAIHDQELLPEEGCCVVLGLGGEDTVDLGLRDLVLHGESGQLAEVHPALDRPPAALQLAAGGPELGTGADPIVPRNEVLERLRLVPVLATATAGDRAGEIRHYPPLLVGEDEQLDAFLGELGGKHSGGILLQPERGHHR